MGSDTDTEQGNVIKKKSPQAIKKMLKTTVKQVIKESVSAYIHVRQVIKAHKVR